MLKIRKYPDPILLKVAEPVVDFGPALANLVDDMFLAMYTERGVGLAAPQVGISRRLYVINCEPEQPREGEHAFVNPEVVAVDGEQYGNEGCLSFPGLVALKRRPNRATVKAQDVEGNWFTFTGEGLTARALLHELDHLNGKVFVQDLEPAEFVKLKKPLEIMRREFKRSR